MDPSSFNAANARSVENTLTYDTYHDEQHIQNIHANVHEHHTIAKKKIEESEKQMDAHNDIRLNIYKNIKRLTDEKMKKQQEQEEEEVERGSDL